MPDQSRQRIGRRNAPLPSIDDKFNFGRVVYRVTQVDKFGSEPHYGVTWQDDDGNYHNGWVASSVVDNFSGF